MSKHDNIHTYRGQSMQANVRTLEEIISLSSLSLSVWQQMFQAHPRKRSIFHFQFQFNSQLTENISGKPWGKLGQAVNLPWQPGQGGRGRQQAAGQDQDRLQLNKKLSPIDMACAMDLAITVFAWPDLVDMGSFLTKEDRNVTMSILSDQVCQKQGHFTSPTNLKLNNQINTWSSSTSL